MKELLELIESVDHDDNGALQKIDARVFCYINHFEFVECERTDFKYMEQDYYQLIFKRPGNTINNYENASRDLPCYCNSRDTLKRIRPEGYIHGGHDGDDPQAFKFEFVTPYPCKCFVGYGKTEELAELHAIIQAIGHQRKNE